jgi:hypothetical protein
MILILSRIGLALGVLKGMVNLDEKIRAAYRKYLEALLQFTAAGATEIQLQQTSGKMDKYPLSEMIASAEEVGYFICTVQLDSFGQKSISDIENWEDSDEQLVTDLTKQLLESKAEISSTLGFDVEHLMAAASLAGNNGYVYFVYLL